jgi:hypothetical protein
MKKFTIALILITAISCTNKSIKMQDDKIETIIQKWGYSIQKLDYALYSKTVKYPAEKEEFKNEYSEFYLTNIIIMSIKDSETRLIGNDRFDAVNVTIGAVAVSRNGGKTEQIQATLELVKLAGTDLDWKIHGKTMLRY